MTKFQKFKNILLYIFPTVGMIGAIVTVIVSFPYWWAFLVASFISFSNVLVEKRETNKKEIEFQGFSNN